MCVCESKVLSFVDLIASVSSWKQFRVSRLAWGKLQFEILQQHRLTPVRRSSLVYLHTLTRLFVFLVIFSVFVCSFSFVCSRTFNRPFTAHFSCACLQHSKTLFAENSVLLTVCCCCSCFKTVRAPMKDYSDEITGNRTMPRAPV